MLLQIIEDDKILSDGIRMALLEPGMEFEQCSTVKGAMASFLERRPQLLVLDINLPDGSGYDYLKWVKAQADVPVLILTANDLEMDEVMGLSLGADDYMTKPFRIAVLRARIQALLRRAAGSRPAQYREAGLFFDFDSLIFKRDGQELAFSVNEQKLLRLLVENRGQILTRTLLFERLWSDGSEFVDENALSVTVNRLRGKLEKKGDAVTWIQTVYGQGYVWKRKDVSHV